MWHIAFLLHRLSGVLKKCLGLLLTSYVLLSLQVWRKTYECRFPTRCLKKSSWNPETATPLSFWLWKVSLKFIKSIAITWENLSIKSTENPCECQWNSGPFVVHIQSGCPHDLGQQVEFLWHFRIPISENHFETAARLMEILGKWMNMRYVAPLFWCFPSTFRGKKKKTWDTLLVVLETMLSEPLTSSSSKKQGGGEFLSDKSLVVCTRSSLPVGPDFGGLLTVGIVVLLAWGNGWWWKIAVIFCSFSFGGIWALEWRPV